VTAAKRTFSSTNTEPLNHPTTEPPASPGYPLPVKLLRFELRNEPGRARSGIVASGRVYETEGGQGVGMHEAAAVRPLVPVAKAPSLRLFRADHQPAFLSPLDEDQAVYFYGNASSLIGPSQLVVPPPYARELTFEAYMAAVILGDAHRVDVEDADGLVLGFSILNVLVARDVERMERALGAGYGRAYDIAAALGPVITTPDELEDQLSDQEFGRQYGLSAVARVNGVERARGTTSDLPITFAQAISTASQSCPLRESDVIALGPIVQSDQPILLDEGDEVQVAVESLGTLSLKLGNQI